MWTRFDLWQVEAKIEKGRNTCLDAINETNMSMLAQDDVSDINKK